MPFNGRGSQQTDIGRIGASTTGVYAWFVLASLPAFVIARLGDADFAGLVNLVAALLVSFALHLLFARVRQRSLDPGWFLHGWLFALLTPADLSLWVVAYGVSGGVLFGSLIFGGSGRYLVSPALLGAVLANASYPAGFATETAAVWHSVATTGDTSWLTAFLLQDSQVAGSVSAAACGFGALLLYVVGAASLRTLAGALIGAAAVALIFSQTADGAGVAALAPHWHWVLGVFPVYVAFILTDPSATAITRLGRWMYGGLAGALVVSLRCADPANPEGTASACLLAMLFAPLIDQCAQRLAMWRWRRGPAA